MLHGCQSSLFNVYIIFFPFQQRQRLVEMVAVPIVCSRSHTVAFLIQLVSRMATETRLGVPQLTTTLRTEDGATAVSLICEVHWKPRVVVIPTLSSMVAPEVVVTTTPVAINDDKVGIMTTLGFQWGLSIDRSLFYLKQTLCSLQQHHNERHGVSNYRRPDSLLNCLFRDRSKKTSKLRVTGFCEGNSPVTGEFLAQEASDAEKCFHLMTSSCLPAYEQATDNSVRQMRVLCQKQLSRAGTSNYMPHIVWGVITCAYPLYLLRAQHSWNMHMIRVLLCFVVVSYRPDLPYPSGLPNVSWSEAFL